MEIEDRVASKQAAIPAFETAIAELERVAGDYLTGPGRVRCLDAFVRDPEAFGFLVEKTLRRTGARSLLGLFVRIVDDEHATVSKRLSRAGQASEDARELDAPSAAELVEQHPHVLDWISRIGATYAHDPRVFREELQKVKGITRAALVEELRAMAQEATRART